MLIDLISNYKNIYFRNNVYVGVLLDVFYIRIDTFKRLFLNFIINLIVFLVGKETIGVFWGRVKMCEVYGYAFLTYF